MMLVVRPLASQVPEADATVTVDGPLTTKSLPSLAIDEQRIGDAKTSFNDVGEQTTGTRLSMATGDTGGIVNEAMSPAIVRLLQFPINVLPSMPVAICTWKVPLTAMGAEN